MLRLPLIALFMLAFVPPSQADTASTTLERIAESGTFRIGYVPDAAPLSFDDAEGAAVGYSIDLCRYIAAAVRKQLGLEDLELEFIPLNSMPERLAAIENGDVDIECGATTVTLSRRERVDFTLMTFITGAAILSRKQAPINSIDELSDQTIAAVRGTTTEDVLRRFADYNDMRIKVRFVATHDDGMALLDAGEVDAYASDRAMLLGQIFRDPGKAGDYLMTKRALSFEPYAMMTRRGDTEFRLVADRALAGVYRGAQIRRLYQQWFGRYGEPLSPIVEAMYQFQAVDE
ncbi:MAG: amino acid ABC transporter substrate-binding protein [Pseudomonadota bacterium]